MMDMAFRKTTGKLRRTVWELFALCLVAMGIAYYWVFPDIEVPEILTNTWMVLMLGCLVILGLFGVLIGFHAWRFGSAEEEVNSDDS